MEAISELQNWNVQNEYSAEDDIFILSYAGRILTEDDEAIILKESLQIEAGGQEVSGNFFFGPDNQDGGWNALPSDEEISTFQGVGIVSIVEDWDLRGRDTQLFFGVY